MGRSSYLDQNMDPIPMDIDHYDVFEVPDTPDSLVVKRSTNRSSRSSSSLVNRELILHDAPGRSGSNSQLNADHLFKQATLARRISETLDLSSPSPGSPELGKEMVENASSQESGRGDRVISINSRSPATRVSQIGDKGRIRDLYMPMQCSNQRDDIIVLNDSPSPSIHDDSARNRRQRWLVKNGCISPNASKMKDLIKVQDTGTRVKCFIKGADTSRMHQPDPVNFKTESTHDDNRRGHGVLNGSFQEESHGHVVPFSPVNKYKEIGNQYVKKAADKSLMHQPELVNLKTESFLADKMKGKGVLNNISLEELQGHVPLSPINRYIEKGDQCFKKAADTRHPELVSFKSESICDDKRKGKGILNCSSISPEELHGHIPFSSINRIPMTKKYSTVMDNTMLNCQEGGDVNRGKTTHNLSGETSLEGGDGTRGKTTYNHRVGSESRLHHDPMNQIKGKRKCGLLKTRASSFTPTAQHPMSRSSKSCNMLPPVIEVDEPLSLKARHTSSEAMDHLISDGSAAMTSQIEADEMLARQLQEEFYHEPPEIVDNAMIDENIAFALQQEEDAHHATSITIRARSNSRDTSSENSTASSLVRSSFPSLAGPSGRRSRVGSRSRIARLRRQFINNEMDLDARLNVLAALEDVFDSIDDIPISNRVLRNQLDFDENDYEMLLTLDENNHHHSGASESQINGLPESVVQSDSNVEDCVICLETPSRGDVIHHLPCLHKFHKRCIDKWLRRKRSCPVCKLDIVYNP